MHSKTLWKLLNYTILSAIVWINFVVFVVAVFASGGVVLEKLVCPTDDHSSTGLHPRSGEHISPGAVLAGQMASSFRYCRVMLRDEERQKSGVPGKVNNFIVIRYVCMTSTRQDGQDSQCRATNS